MGGVGGRGSGVGGWGLGVGAWGLRLGVAAARANGERETGRALWVCRAGEERGDQVYEAREGQGDAPSMVCVRRGKGRGTRLQ